MNPEDERLQRWNRHATDGRRCGSFIKSQQSRGRVSIVPECHGPPAAGDLNARRR